MSKVKQVLAGVLSASMIVTLMPAVTFAANSEVCEVKLASGTVLPDTYDIEGALGAVDNGGTITVMSGTIDTATDHFPVLTMTGKDYDITFASGATLSGLEVTLPETDYRHCLVADGSTYHFYDSHNFTSAGATCATAKDDFTTTADVTLYCTHGDVSHTISLGDYGLEVDGTYDVDTLSDGHYTATIDEDVAEGLNSIFFGTTTGIFTGLTWLVDQSIVSNVYVIDASSIDYVKDGTNLAVLNAQGTVDFYAKRVSTTTGTVEKNADGSEKKIAGTIVKTADLTSPITEATDTTPFLTNYTDYVKVANGADFGSGDVKADANNYGTSSYKVSFENSDGTTVLYWIEKVVDEKKVAPATQSIDHIELLYTSESGAEEWVDSDLSFEGSDSADPYKGQYVTISRTEYYLLDEDGCITYRAVFNSSETGKFINGEAMTITPVAKNKYGEESESHVCGYHYYAYDDVEVRYTDAAGNIKSSTFRVAPRELAGVHEYDNRQTWAKQCTQFRAPAHNYYGCSYSSSTNNNPYPLACLECNADQIMLDTENIWTGVQFNAQPGLPANQRVGEDAGRYYCIIPKTTDHTLLDTDRDGNPDVTIVEATCQHPGYSYNICTVSDGNWTFDEETEKYEYVLKNGKTTIDTIPSDTNNWHPILTGQIIPQVDHAYVVVQDSITWSGVDTDTTFEDDVTCAVDQKCAICDDTKHYVYHSITAKEFLATGNNAENYKLDEGSTDTITVKVIGGELGLGIHVFGKVEPTVTEGANCSVKDKIAWTVIGVVDAYKRAITSEQITSDVYYGPHTYEYRVDFSGNGKEATVNMRCSKCNGSVTRIDKDGNKGFDSKAATVTPTENTDGSTTYTATLEGVTLKNNTKRVFDLTKAVVTVNGGEVVDINEIPDVYDLKEVTSVTINGVEIDEDEWTIESKDTYGNLVKGANNLAIVPNGSTSIAVDSKAFVLNCIQPALLTIRDNDILFDGMNRTTYAKKVGDGAFTVENGFATIGYQWIEDYDEIDDEDYGYYSGRIYYDPETTHTFSLSVVDRATMTSTDADIKYAVSTTPISYSKIAESATLSKVEVQDAGYYFVYASITKEGYTPINRMVATIEIDRLPIGPIYVDKQVMSYGDTINATTGDAELDELIGLSSEISSTLYVGEYKWADVLEYNPNYYGVPTIAGTTAEVDTLTIEKRNATIVMKEASSTYTGEAVDTSTLFTIDGAVNGDTLNVIVNTAGNKDIVDAGEYTLVATANDANYNIEKVTATYTVKPASIAKAVVTPKKTSMVWTGKALKPGVKSVVLPDGTKLATTDYSVAYTNNKNVGTAKITVKGKGNYTGTATATFKITKATQKVKSTTPATGKTKTYTATALKKANKTFTIKATASKEQGTAQFKKVSGNAKITLTSAGKVTVKKGLAKGTYTLKYKVRIKATKNCKATAYVNKTVKIKVK